nr:hypothetical protein Itr_chr05CG04240 [Ipomoea trifida]
MLSLPFWVRQRVLIRPIPEKEFWFSSPPQMELSCVQAIFMANFTISDSWAATALNVARWLAMWPIALTATLCSTQLIFPLRSSINGVRTPALTAISANSEVFIV